MSILGNLLSGKIRSEMRKRVDEIINAGDKWQKTAEDLIKALNQLTEAIEKGNPTNLKPAIRETKKLVRQTKRLSRAFESHRKTLTKIERKIELD